MRVAKDIPLFYWSSRIFENKDRENYGDLLSAYLVQKINGRPAAYYNAPKKRKSWFPKKHLFAIGSIIGYATPKSLIWGSGIIKADDTWTGGTHLAVRGPKTRQRALAQGFKCPEVYGDPALLLPRYYRPEVPKTTTLGIIPHYVNYNKVKVHYQGDDGIEVIDLLCQDIEPVTRQIMACKSIISSSLHGLILAHAYGIPAIWVQFSDKLTGDNIKFEDYLLSVGLQAYTGPELGELPDGGTLAGLVESYPNKPDEGLLNHLQEGLLNAYPKQ